MMDLHDMGRRIAINLIGVLSVALAACGGSDSTLRRTEINRVNPAVSSLLGSVDAIGVGGSGLLSNNPARADLELQSNAKGAIVQLRFSCTACNITVSAAGAASVGANQYIGIAFPSLDTTATAAANVSVVVTDNRNGATAQYTLHARPLDHVRYSFNANAPQAGDLYVAPFDPQGFAASYAYIVENDGSLKYYHRNPRGRNIHDFKKTVLTGGAVRYSFYDSAASAIRIMDGGFNLLDNVQALPFPDGNTYAVNLHDHKIVDDGHYILGVHAAKVVSNIPALPGQSLFVGGSGLQEIVNGVAVFNWLSTDHPELYACSTQGNAYAQNNGADYAHWDSLYVDSDTHWIASFRHLDAVLKIDRASGAIRWILGGVCDQFGLTAAQKFSRQHDANRAPDGRLTLFDNHNGGAASRVLAFNLEETAKILVTGNPTMPGFAEFTSDMHQSFNLGSAQIFDSGKVLVGWGEFPSLLNDVSEFDLASGAQSMRLTLLPSSYSNGYFSDRARKSP
jgi:arylsulfate sulfotransferase